MDKKINPSILSLIGFLAIIAFAVASDRLVLFLYRWFMRSTETIAYRLFLWAQSLQVLLFALIFILFSWLVLSRAKPNQIVAFVFIVTGLLLVFYPVLYMFTPAGQTALFVYLTTYHSSQSSSILYFSGGLIAALGFILLARNLRNSARGNAYP
jgi:hypothetical protein